MLDLDGQLARRKRGFGMIVWTASDKVFMGAFFLRVAIEDLHEVYSKEGKLVATFGWDEGNQVLDMTICPSGDWPDEQGYLKMYDDLTREVGVKERAYDRETARLEYLKKDK